jgi:TRAP-type mannitol/chloroaromatic compound transport system permease small subunit
MKTEDEANDRLPWLRWIDRFSVLLAILGGVATIGLMLNVVVDVAGRSWFNRPLPGTLDLTQYAWMPTLVSLALGFALLRAEHIRVNLLTAPTGERTQRIIEVVGMLFVVVMTAMFIWFGMDKANDAMSYGEKAVGTPWLDIWPYRWVVVLGLAGLLLQALAQLLRAITVEKFIVTDDDEAAVALAAEETVFEELEHELEDESETTRRVETR